MNCTNSSSVNGVSISGLFSLGKFGYVVLKPSFLKIKNRTMKYYISIFILSWFIIQCGESEETQAEEAADEKIKTWVKNPPIWTKRSNIYQVNIRQHTPEGTFRALLPHMDRLAKMGVDIICFMPIQSIGEKNRKGSLGNPYSIKDYRAVNPEFGNMDDFKNLVEKIHTLDMKVIIDWVPNQTSSDNPWAENKEWYLKRREVNFQSSPEIITSDVIDLDYSNKEMHQAMIDAMHFWLSETNIDGFKCVAASKVPKGFWIDCRKQLDEEKDIFFLAEGDSNFLHEAFDGTYNTGLYNSLNEIAKGRVSTKGLLDNYEKNLNQFNRKDFRIQFITNANENSNNGTIKERMGKASDVCFIMALTSPGIPMLYSGQEAGLNKRLELYEKDNIDWSNLSKSDFYKEMLKLKHDHSALWNGDFGGDFTIHETDNPSVAFFSRNAENDAIHVLMNFSNGRQVASSDQLTVSEWKQEKMVGSSITIDNKGTRISLDPWSYAIFSSK